MVQNGGSEIIHWVKEGMNKVHIQESLGELKGEGPEQKHVTLSEHILPNWCISTILKKYL